MADLSTPLPTPRAITSVHERTAVAGLTWVEDRQVILGPDRCAEWDPFLLWGEDRFRAPGGFPDHPHRGFETVTLVLDGTLAHGDSSGERGVLHTGDVQWMTAGRGVIHHELPVGDAPVRGMQLWVNLPAAVKMTEPRYQHLSVGGVATRTIAGGQVRVWSGSSGAVHAATANHVAVTMLELRLETGAHLDQDLPGDRNAFFYLIEGSARVGAAATPLRAGEVARSAPLDGVAATTLAVRADTALHGILIAGRPLREPVVFGGPFVMNTAEEVAQARADLEAGRLV